MSTFRILLAEIRYRKLNSALSLLAVAIAVALFVAGPILVEGYGRASQAELQALQQRVTQSAARVTQSEKQAAAELARLEDETRRLMRNLGFNLMLVDRDTDIIRFLSTRIPTIDMPEEFIHRLANDKRLTMVTHLVAALRATATWQGHPVQLVGYLPEQRQSHMPHESPMGYEVERGAVLLGYRLGQGRKVDETIEVLGKQFRVAQILPEQGSDEDATITMHLRDAQEVLQRPGKINLILALECRCPEAALPAIRQQLARVLPETQPLRDTSKADARANMRASVAQKHQELIQRQKEVLQEREKALADTAARRERIQGLMETLAGVVTPLVVLASAVWVGLLALANVRERRTEIGLLRALGKGSGMIAGLFLGKAVLLGLLGAAIGLLLGSYLSAALGVRLLDTTYAELVPRWEILVATLAGAPLLSAVASYLPTLAAVMQDPAVVLRDQ